MLREQDTDLERKPTLRNKARHSVKSDPEIETPTRLRSKVQAHERQAQKSNSHRKLDVGFEFLK